MWLKDIAQYLSDHYCGTFSETNSECSIFIEHLPDDGEFIIGLFSAPSEPPDVKTRLERPSLLVIVRGNRNPKDTFDFAQTVYKTLHNAKDIPSEDYHIKHVAARQSGMSLWARDDNTRYEYSCEYTLIMEEK